MIIAGPSIAPQGSPIITASSSYGAITTSDVNIFTPVTVDVNCYNHGCRIYRIPGSSRIHLLWSQGARNEDGAGTHIVGCYSDDDGATWSSIVSITTAFEATDLTGTVDCHLVVIGELVTFSSRSFILGEIQFVTWAAGLQTSRVSMGLIAMEVTGGVFGAPKWITGSGLSLSSWTGSDLSNLYMAMSSPGYPAGGINSYHYPKIANGAVDNMIECGTYKYSGGWLRVGRGYNVTTGALLSFIYTQWSPDGVVWSTEQVTGIANSPSLVAPIKMANGKYAFFWNPDGDRNKLTLAVGTDGLTFGTAYSVRSGTGTTPTFSGAYKGGGPQYPSTLELASGHLLVAYSIKKESVAVTNVTVP